MISAGSLFLPLETKKSAHLSWTDFSAEFFTWLLGYSIFKLYTVIDELFEDLVNFLNREILIILLKSTFDG